jgi:predicted P-loop ATPase
MRLAFYKDHKDKQPACVDATWDELAQALLSVTLTECAPCVGKDCPAKYGEAWSPVDISGTRANEHVQAVTVAVFDLDHLDDAMLLDVAQKIEGLEYVFHSTHTEHCYRLVMPLSRDARPDEWRTFLRAAVTAMELPIATPCATCKAARAKGKKPDPNACEDRAHCMRGVDPACKDLSRLYFLPTCPCTREPLAERGTGVALDVDAILSLAQGAVAPPVIDDVPPDVEEELSTDVPTLRARLADVRRHKASSTKPEERERYEILGRVLKGEPLAQPGARDNTVNQAAALVAFAVAARTPVEAAMELMRPSLSAMEVEPEGLGHWQDRAERSYRRAMERRIERDETADAANETLRHRLRNLSRAREPQHAALTIRKPDPEEDEPAATVEAVAQYDDGSWKELLIPRADGAPKVCGENVVVVLSQQPWVKGTFRFNEVTKEVEVHGGPFAGVAPEVLDIAVTDWLTRHFGIGLSVSEVGQRIMRVARMHSYDPLRDYLRGLEWDGTKRAHRFLTYYCDAKRTDALGNDITAHLERIGTRWLISAVARALRPGCQVDTVLVLEGAQGLRKTSALRVMGGDYFAETQLVLGDKDADMLAASSWIVELAELASLRRTETNAQKAWITKRTARIRLPYGRTLSTLPRRCVLAGSINPDEGGYLVDRTGNRRYWPAECGPQLYHRLVELERDRDQLWAEAVVLLDADEPWWLTEAEQACADEQAEERLGESATEARVARWWFAQHPSKRPELLTSHEVAERALELPFDRITRGVQTEVGTALRRLGCTKARITVDGRLTWVYRPTRELKDAPQGRAPNAPHLRLLAGAKKDAGQG